MKNGSGVAIAELSLYIYFNGSSLSVNIAHREENCISVVFLL